MPSSLIIVALAGAWLVVLVPMVARKRQTVARTADAELAARVVRSAEDDFSYTEPVQEVTRPPEAFEDEAAPARREPATPRYRPGRGGFDPEAAEIAARAKYSLRQRVVLVLIIASVASAVTAGILGPKLWWVHGAIDVTLVGYLGYLRRQVRIENEIRQRRLARLRRPAPRRTEDYDRPDDYDRAEPREPRREPVRPERRPPLAPPVRGNAVVVDVDDEDPEFHELDDPGQLPFRRAAGE